MIMRRLCNPNFVAYQSQNNYMEYPVTTYTSTNCGGGGDYDSNGQLYYYSSTCTTPTLTWERVYVEPSPEMKQAQQARRQACLKNMVRVLYSDQRLLDMADHLDGLYGDLNSIQQQYDEMTAAKRAARIPAKPNLGPRRL